MFTDAEYNSADGMNTRIWGPMLWNFLHVLSFNYPTNPTEHDKDNYHGFLVSLKHILPCKACRDNYAKNLETVGYTRDCLENRKTFSMFIYRLHNCVNKMLGKDCTLTYNQVRDRFEIFRARCVNETPVVPKHIASTPKEKGCESPLTGIKSKTVINIVPLETRCDSFKIDPRCIPKRAAQRNPNQKNNNK